MCESMIENYSIYIEKLSGYLELMSMYGDAFLKNRWLGRLPHVINITRISQDSGKIVFLLNSAWKAMQNTDMILTIPVLFQRIP